MERGEGRSAKAAIVEALVQLSNERPFEEISITEITRRAGVSRMAFYRSYRSKGEVLEQQAAELSSSLHRLAVRGETAEARLTRCFTFLREERAFFSLLLQAGEGESLLRLWTRQLEDLSAEDGWHYRAQLLAGAAYGVCAAWLLRGAPDDPRELARYLAGSLPCAG